MLNFLFALKRKKNLELRKEAYIELYQQKKFKKIRSLRQKLESIKFPIKSSTNLYDFELATRQYYLNLFGFSRMESAILLSLGSGKSIKFFPIHTKHIKVFKEEGIEVSIFWTKISFWAVNFIMWFRAAFRLIVFIIKPHKRVFKNKYYQPFIYFDKLSKNNLPAPSPNNKSYDVITWYLERFKPTEKKIFHNVEGENKLNYKEYSIEYIDGPIPLPKNIFLYSLSSLFLLLKLFFELLAGRWWKGLMAHELLEEHRFNFCTKHSEKFQRKFLFYNSMTFYRPIWTYLAEVKGSQIISYFYSTSDTLMPPSGEEKNSEYVALMNWPEMWFWDYHQKKLFGKSFNFKIKSKIVGPIPFSTTSKSINETKKIKISIFDSPPYRVGTHFGFSTSNEMGLNEPDIHIKFLKDILDSFNPFEVYFYYKPKRNRSSIFESDSYFSYINELKKLKNFCVLDGDISAFYLIEKSNIVISFPFTSPGVVGNLKHKFSIYYDPSKKVSQFDEAKRDIELLSSKKDLKTWAINAVNKIKGQS